MEPGAGQGTSDVTAERRRGAEGRLVCRGAWGRGRLGSAR